VLAVSYDAVAHIIDLDGGEMRTLRLLRGELQGFVHSASFSPDGSRILTVLGDDTARLWDLEGREIAVLRGPGGAVSEAVYSARGDRIVTTAQDGTIRVWLADTKDLVAAAERRIARELTDEEREKYADLLGR